MLTAHPGQEKKGINFHTSAEKIVIAMCTYVGLEKSSINITAKRPKTRVMT